MIYIFKGFSVVNEVEVDVLLEFSCFFYDPTDVAIWSLGSSAFSKSSLNIWKFSVHVLLKPTLENFEHYFASIWDEHNCVVVWSFFGIAFLWDLNESWPFPMKTDSYLVERHIWSRIPSPSLTAWVCLDKLLWFWLPGFHGVYLRGRRYERPRHVLNSCQRLDHTTPFSIHSVRMGPWSPTLLPLPPIPQHGKCKMQTAWLWFRRCHKPQTHETRISEEGKTASILENLV